MCILILTICWPSLLSWKNPWRWHNPFKYEACQIWIEFFCYLMCIPVMNSTPFSRSVIDFYFDRSNFVCWWGLSEFDIFLVKHMFAQTNQLVINEFLTGNNRLQICKIICRWVTKYVRTQIVELIEWKRIKKSSLIFQI